MRIFIVSILVLVALLVVGSTTGYWKYHKAIMQPLNLESERIIEIPTGASPNTMLLQLEKDGIIKDVFWLKLYWRFELKNQSIHVGEYRLKSGMHFKDLVNIWTKGEVVRYKIVLIEGWNFKQFRAALAAQQPLKQLTRDMTDMQIMAALNSDRHPEGQFYPDTYLYIKTDSDLDILKRAHKKLQQVLDEEWSTKAEELPYENAYQALIMASLIEKETGLASEREQIAGVFIRRIQKNMLLQTDPTVIYGMGDKYNGKITRADLQRETLYNTYIIAGLPPTPIAMVGREAIHAALHPAEGKALYFVAKGDGSHKFSENLTEHNKAVREYQLKRRTDYRSSPLPDEAK